MQPTAQSWLTYLPSLEINSLLDRRALTNSGVARSVGNSGVAANIDAAGDYLQYTPASEIPSAFHLVSVFDLNSSSTFSRLFEAEASSVGADLRFGIWFAPSTSSGATGNASSVVIVRNVSGGGGNEERWSTPSNSLVRPASNVTLEIIWNATSSDTTTPLVWINGVAQTMTKAQSSVPSSTAFASLTSVPLRIGNRFGTLDRGMLGRLYLLHIERQTRSTPYINPWQLFRPDPARLYFDVPSGGTSATASGVTITATTSVIAGAASGVRNATASGVTVTATASMIAGAASAGTNATALGTLITAVASFIAGAASGVRNATASGTLMTATASLVPGDANNGESALGTRLIGMNIFARLGLR